MDTSIAKKLTSTVNSVITSDVKLGFEKAFLIAEAAGELKKSLTAEYMKPIMELQNNRLGFKTDKEAGYPEAVVKNCLIEAVLTGVQPFGNQFNIIAGNCYITKEGFGHLLANLPGLQYEIIPELPRIGQDAKSAAVVMKITWTLNGVTNERKIDFPIKMNQYMGTDAVIGKATRKARAWLFNNINGIEIADGDVMDTRAEVVSSTVADPKEKQLERMKLLINAANTTADLDRIAAKVPDELLDLFTVKKDELKGK
jgi:hypothetical protein